MGVANLETQASPWSQFPGSPSGTARHDDIYFVDENTGWSVRATGLIHKTTDGGNTWALKLTKTGTHFRCIGFASATRGFAGNLGAGSYDGAVTDTNVLYQTLDGGDTWKNVPGFKEAGMKGLCAMYILDANHIFGGGRVRSPAYFIKSTDGGDNWTIRNLTTMGIMNGIMDIYFKDPLNGFVVGMDPHSFSADCSTPYYGRIAKTTDGGETWTSVLTTTVSCAYCWKMSWPTPQIGFVSLQQNGSYNKVIYYQTTDGGDNWTQKNIALSSVGLSPSSFYLQGIGFVSPEEGWIGGTSGIPYPSSFLHTTDGGVTWSATGYNDTYRINRIRFLNSGFGVAAGERLHVFHR
jgi:photosystem II stability/assembly factor-like uncharacterized protein